MDLILTAEQQAFVAAIRKLARRECGTWDQRAALTDNGTVQHNPALYRRIAALGWLGAAIPTRYGGAGGGAVDMCLFLEEASYGQIPIAGFSVSMIVAGAYQRWGTESQKEDVLRAISDGSVHAIAISEPDAGSDVGAIRCRAVRDGDHYVLTGQKTWISEAHIADSILVVCRTDASGGRHDGLSMIAVPRDAAGVDIRGIDTLGGRTVNEVHLTDVRIPLTARLGAEGAGWEQLVAGLNAERLILAAVSLGLARRALDDLLAHVRDRHQFGRPVGRFQALRHRIADLATEIECCRLLVYAVARLLDTQPQTLYPLETSMAKLKASETARRVALEGIQMMGGQGYAVGSDMQRHARIALAGTIYGGTSEIQRDIIGRAFGL
ncbi:acyl-CoA dehydrogenase family protein [Plantactinospora sp. WMMB334]|uniref:acyl-CoA dehydrogenase family protein n=1 Tax=Plantactinospora sp. WMMB334 TaxID=3404119 RepID=UPI003B92CE96